MIMGELRRYLRDSGSIRVSRSMRDLAYKAMQAREKLTNDNSKEPTIEQIAKEIDAKLICTPKVRHIWRCIFLWAKQEEKTKRTRQNSKSML